MVSTTLLAGPTYRYMSGSKSKDGIQIFRAPIGSSEFDAESDEELSRARVADGMAGSETSILDDQPGGIFMEGIDNENEPFGDGRRPGRQRISGRDDSLVTPQGVPLEDAMAPMILLITAFAAFKFYKK